MSDVWSSVYESPLHHPAIAWVGVALGALALARRLPFLHGYLVVFGLEIFADALASAPFTKLPGAWATAVGVTFVVLGDLRFFVLVERHARAASSLTARALLAAVALSLVVPAASTAIRLAVPAVAATPRLQYLVYEVAFLAVALAYAFMVLPLRLADAPPDVRRWLGAVALFEAAQYALWALADVIIHFGGQSWGLGLRLLPNALYYALFLPFVFVTAPARMRAVA